MKKKIEDKLLTILVPIKDRKQFTIRFFRFYTKFNFKYKLFIADGGKNKLNKEDLKILDENKIQYKYKSYPYDKDLKTYVEKISKSLNSIDTKYVMIFDNDDFLIKSTINRCLYLLENNTKLKACSGYLINFDLHQPIKSRNLIELYGEPINFKKMKHGNNFLSNNKYKRINNYFFNKDINTYNDICLTKNLKKVYQELAKLTFNYIYFYFILADIMNYHNGQIMRVNLPSIIHQLHKDSFSMKEITLGKLLNSDPIKNKKFNKEKKFFFRYLENKFPNKKILNYTTSYFKKVKIKNSNKNFSSSLTKKNFFFTYFLNHLSLVKILYRFFFNYYLKIKNIHVEKIMKNYQNSGLNREIFDIINFIKKKSF
tara:strand:+ start:733 stop:1842 length:1110 start_codon:yes stop_codon:yes gene_type:complete